MGRRSINTTKSGKYMNPTDQARKEARKKELKKNKKQRQMVRAAVLKGKDPQQIVLELEKIDQMEYNVLQPSPLNEKVLKDKRKKLKDTLDRVLKMYNKDDPDKWAELKRLQVDYERKRSTLFNYYESVKNAQSVQVDEIPLPINALTPELQAVFVGMPSQIPLPPLISNFLKPGFVQPQGILKKGTSFPLKAGKREPPGVPPGPPPTVEQLEDDIQSSIPVPEPPIISMQPKKTIRFADEEEPMSVDQEQSAVSGMPNDSQDVNDDVDDDDDAGMDTYEKYDDRDVRRLTAPDLDGPKPTSLQRRMLAMAGQDIDQFMQEMEQVHKKRREQRAANLEARLQGLPEKDSDMEMGHSADHGPGLDHISHPNSGMPPLGMLPGLPPMMFRPPPPRGIPSILGIRLPPGPPPGLPPRLGIRLPPGPPPGLPPRMLRPPLMPTVAPAPVPPQSNVLSAAPQLISRPEPTGPTIEARAKIRNLSADVTRFLPTALRVKKDDKNKNKPKFPSLQDAKVEVIAPAPKPTQTKDDAYKQFMREMEGLL